MFIICFKFIHFCTVLCKKCLISLPKSSIQTAVSATVFNSWRIMWQFQIKGFMEHYGTILKLVISMVKTMEIIGKYYVFKYSFIILHNKISICNYSFILYCK